MLLIEGRYAVAAIATPIPIAAQAIQRGAVTAVSAPSPRATVASPTTGLMLLYVCDAI